MGFLKKLFGGISSPSSSSSSGGLDDLFETIPRRDCIFKSTVKIRDACDMSLDDAMKHSEMFWFAWDYVQKNWNSKLSTIAKDLAERERSMAPESKDWRKVTLDKQVETGVVCTRNGTISKAEHDEYTWHQAIFKIHRDLKSNSGNYRTQLKDLWEEEIAIWGNADAAAKAADVLQSTLIVHDLAVHDSLMVGSDELADFPMGYPTFVPTTNGYTVKTYQMKT